MLGRAQEPNGKRSGFPPCGKGWLFEVRPAPPEPLERRHCDNLQLPSFDRLKNSPDGAGMHKKGCGKHACMAYKPSQAKTHPADTARLHRRTSYEGVRSSLGKKLLPRLPGDTHRQAYTGYRWPSTLVIIHTRLRPPPTANEHPLICRGVIVVAYKAGRPLIFGGHIQVGLRCLWYASRKVGIAIDRKHQQPAACNGWHEAAAINTRGGMPRQHVLAKGCKCATCLADDTAHLQQQN